MASAKPFTFICGADDFLVNRAGKDRFDAAAREVPDEMSREILNGFALNVAEVETAVNRFRESVQTVSMFGDKRLVWFKDVNFLADSVTGRAESTLKVVEDWQELLASLDPAQVTVLVTASPIDRRRAFPKWCEKNADFLLVGGDADQASDALVGVLLAEAKGLGISFVEGAAELLIARTGANTRLLMEEVHKLAAYVGERPEVTEADVLEMSPNVAEGDFFEVAELFFKADITGTLRALERHFFTGGDARPVISALQNRNRLLLQIRALLNSGEVKQGPRGLSGLDKAGATFGRAFIGATEKGSYNIFTQNPWYLGKLAGGAAIPAAARLIDNQHEFIVAFEQLIERPNEQQEVLREMVVRCLAK